MTEQDKKELHKYCLQLFTDTACKENYEMQKGIFTVVEYVLNQVGKLPIDSVMQRICHCSEPKEYWDSGQTNICDNCDKVIDAA